MGDFAKILEDCGLSPCDELARILRPTTVGIRADPDSSRQERLVAIASVALPKRECARSLKPRRKRGVWECAQWTRDEAGWSAGWVGVPAKLGVCS